MNGVEASSLVGVSVKIIIDGTENSTLTAEATTNVADSNGGYSTNYDISTLLPGQVVNEIWTLPDGVGIGMDAIYVQTYVVPGLNGLDLEAIANYLYMRSQPSPAPGYFRRPCGCGNCG
jgi:hypothetical protein